MKATVTVISNPYRWVCMATIAQVMLHSINTINAIRLLFPTSHIPISSKAAAMKSMRITPFSNSYSM